MSIIKIVDYTVLLLLAIISDLNREGKIDIW